jgi:hypothetical protein
VNIGTFSAWHTQSNSKTRKEKETRQEKNKKEEREMDMEGKTERKKKKTFESQSGGAREREIQNCGNKNPRKKSERSSSAAQPVEKKRNGPVPIWWHTTARPHHFHSKQDQYKYCNETRPSPAVWTSSRRAVGAEPESSREEEKRG